ncbi:hypothetical protein CRUP_032740, partial [Coryphaenoides rupestris]
MRLTSPASPGSREVATKSLPRESYALISMPQLVSGCLSHTLKTCLTSMLFHELTPAFTSIFSERMPMCRLPSVAGIRREICRNTVVASSAARREVATKSLPRESYALISMPQLVSGCLSHTLKTCLTSMLFHELTPAFTSIFSERMPMCRLPSVAGIRREICRNTVVASSAARRCTHSWARTMRLACILWLKEKKQHLGVWFTWTT